MSQEYIVSARKYRPMTFDSVVGQESLTRTLKNAIISGKLAHAYLFCGPRGVGKTTCARIFARNINCLHPHDGEACGECESCKAFNEGRSFNIYELDAASNNSVDDIRAITEQVHIPPQIGKYKVYIIDEVHMLSTAAFNAFLKTLEEPPKFVIFILATTEKHKLLPTILSRCQIYDFNRMEVQDIVSHLTNVAAKENIEVEPAALNVIARKADGGMRDALSIFDQVASYGNGKITYQAAIENLNILDYEYYFDICEKIAQHRIPETLIALDNIIRKGFDPGLFINGLAAHFRDLIVALDKNTLPLLDVSDAVKARYHEQAVKFKPRFLYNAAKIANNCDFNYRASKNKRLQVEIALIAMAQMDDEGGESSSGLSPDELKPLFKTSEQQDATPKPNAAVREAAAERQNDTVALAKATKPSHTNATKPSIQKLGVSIKSAAKVGETPTPYGNDATQVPTNSPVTDQTVNEENDFDENDLKMNWRLFANSLSAEDNALKGRMLSMDVRKTGAATFAVTAASETVAALIKEKEEQITLFLRQQLRNCKLKMTLDVAQTKQQKVLLSPREKYQEMVSRNPAFADLVKTLGLEPD